MKTWVFGDVTLCLQLAIPDVSKDRTTIFRNVGTCLPHDTAVHPTGVGSWEVPLWEPEMSHGDTVMCMIMWHTRTINRCVIVLWW